jgi:membrane protease YdiL (CAAX protease family)
VAFLVVRPRWAQRTPPPPVSPGLPAPGLPTVEETRSPQLLMVSRYVVGARGLAAATHSSDLPAAALLENVDRAAVNPIDEFRAIPVAGELLGKQAALERLAAFERKHKVVRLREDVDALWALYTDGPDRLSTERARHLVERHGWFGKLALAYGLPRDDPRRTAAMAPAQRTVVIWMAIVILAILALLVGLALAILTLVLRLQRKILPAYGPPPPGRGDLLVEAFALYLAGMIGVGLVLGRWFGNVGLAGTFVIFPLLGAVLVYLRLRGMAWVEMREHLGLRRGRGVLREVGVGLYGYLAGLPLLVGGGLVTWALMKYTGTTATHPIANEPVDTAWQVAQLFLLASVGAPLVEETMFRGALFGHLRARVGWWVSAPVVSLVFAAIHPQGWVAIPVLGSIALILAALREYRGSLIAPMTAHALNNALAVLMMVLMMGQ